MFEKRLENLQSLEEDNGEGEDSPDLYEERSPFNRTLIETGKKKSNLIKTFGTDAGVMTTSNLMEPFNDFTPTKKVTRGAWNIYFYMSELTKIKKTSGIQFITDRYLKKSKEFYK